MAEASSNFTTTDDPPVALSVDEARRALGNRISRRAFYNGIRNDEIPHVRIGRRILIPRLKFLRWAGLDTEDGAGQ